MEKLTNQNRATQGVAAVLALFLGGIGIHRFYLRRPLSGFFYLILCWTLVPALLGVCEAFMCITMKPENWERKYNS